MIAMGKLCCNKLNVIRLGYTSILSAIPYGIQSGLHLLQYKIDSEWTKKKLYLEKTLQKFQKA